MVGWLGMGETAVVIMRLELGGSGSQGELQWEVDFRPTASEEDSEVESLQKSNRDEPIWENYLW